MRETKQGTLSILRNSVTTLVACLAIAVGLAPASRAFADPGIYPSGMFSTEPAYSLVNPARPGDEGQLLLQLNRFSGVPPARPSEPKNLFTRMRKGFALPAIVNRRVEAEINWYLRHPDYLERVFTRAQRYMPYIVEAIEARGMPVDLALLPVVESAYDPFAYSHGRAAGLWQIIPGTASRFGVRQNWWYDGRRDVVDSTRAALDYLAYLHDIMDGDWLLAIASYNSGEGNVMRAVRRNRAKSAPTDFWSLGLPSETRSYVPRLLAIVAIVKNPAAFGLELPAVRDEPQFIEADIGSQVDLALAADLAGIDLDTLYSMNAGYNRWATDPSGPHRLQLPLDVYDAFRAALGEVPQDERVRWQRHQIAAGDTLSGIAEKYHTTLASIRGANNLRGNTIRAGQFLVIPVAAKPLAEYSQSADARRERKQNTPRSGFRVEHVVASGDSFWSIGQQYDVDMRKLAAWNGMAPRDTLSVGQQLVIWTQQANPRVSAAVNGMTRKLRYTVRRGDSLSLIASRFRITVSDLVRWNNIDKSKIIRPGQRLTMFVDVTAQSS